MGCDIHSRVQVFKDGEWKTVEARLFPDVSPDLFDAESRWSRSSPEPFTWRCYGMFAFLADVRNYSFVPPLSKARGFSEDMKGCDSDDFLFGEHSFSWLGLDELLAFNYDQTFEDRRWMKDGNGAADAGAGNGVMVTFRDFLGPHFFRDLAIMRCLGEPSQVRVVFGFDN